MKRFFIFYLLFFLVACPSTRTNPTPSPTPTQGEAKVFLDTTYGVFSGSADFTIIQNKPLILEIKGALDNANHAAIFNFAFSLPLSSNNDTDQASFRFTSKGATIHNSSIYFPNYTFTTKGDEIIVTYTAIIKGVKYNVNITLPKQANFTHINSPTSPT